MASNKLSISKEVKTTKLASWLASGGDIYSPDVLGHTGFTPSEALEVYSDSEFKARVKTLQDDMHYESIRRLKASTPLAVALLIDAVTTKRGSTTSAAIASAKMILEFSGAVGGVYEDESALNPNPEELLKLILSIPVELRAIGIGEDSPEAVYDPLVGE